MTELVVRLLGPVEVQAGDRPAATLPPSVRSLLARLALSPQRVVSVDALTDALWGAELPGDAGNALQLRVSKLRRALAAAGADSGVLITRAPGYRLAVPAEAVDAFRFPREAERAREAALGGDPAAALALADAALGLWRGPVLADVGDAPWAEAERTRLEELRLGLVEDRLELLLETGRHIETVPDLERLVAEHTLRERPHRLLMLALYRGGRQADALAAYHRLRRHLGDELGIDPGPDLRALAEAILRQQVMPVRYEPAPVSPTRSGEPAPVVPGAMPHRLTSLVGRDDDLATLLSILRDARMVTLTGPGGVGKTTLALEAARQDSDAGRTAHLIRLAALPAGSDVGEAFATQLGLAVGGAAAVDAIIARLVASRALLVVDNCEHLVDDVAAVVERVVAACPGVQVLATSREALAVTGETQVAVAPLGLPGDTDDVAAAAAAPAVQLFADRARAVRPDFRLDPATVVHVASICRQLDGMPLAIELAAARVKALPPEQIAVRLQDRFALLTSGPRTSDARHRTLRAVLDWSHDLLSDPERRLLRRLAVFRGGWTLADAEQVCAFAGIAPADVADLLFRLVDRSLVVPDPATGRFRLLVTVREYARERLTEAGEAQTCRDRHLDRMIGVAETLGPGAGSDETAQSRLREEHDNLRAAVERGLERAATDPGPAVRLIAATMQFWMYGLRFEALRALRALLDAGTLAPPDRAWALGAIGRLHVYYPTPESKAASRAALALFEQLGDARQAAVARLTIAWEGQYDDDTEAHLAMVEQARVALGDADHGQWQATAQYVEASLLLGGGDADRAAAAWRRSLELLRPVGDRVLISASLAHLGVSLRLAGRLDEAVPVLAEAVADARRMGTPHGLAFALVHLAHARLDREPADQEAAALLAEADEVARAAQNPRCQAWSAWGCARIALAASRTQVAADECRRARELLEDREFPWARAQLDEFSARVAGARTA